VTIYDRRHFRRDSVEGFRGCVGLQVVEGRQKRGGPADILCAVSGGHNGNTSHPAAYAAILRQVLELGAGRVSSRVTAGVTVAAGRLDAPRVVGLDDRIPGAETAA